MARHPDWFERLDAILEVIRRSDGIDWIGRKEKEGHLRDQLAAVDGRLDGLRLLESQVTASAAPACSSECWRWRAIDRSN